MKNLILILVLIFNIGISNAQSVSKKEVGDLTFHIYKSSLENFGVTSVLIEGKKELLLVDAQFSNAEAKRIVEVIKSTNKPLKTIYISHYDPDFYFGLKLIVDAFPQVNILSTAQTAYLIDETKDEKLQIWKDVLKENAPVGFIIPQAIQDEYFYIENHKIEIKSSNNYPDHSYLWIPSVKSILGGISLDEGSHIWLADSKTLESRTKWVKQLDEMQQLNPRFVIPAHFASSKKDINSSSAITFTREYLLNAEIIEKETNNSMEFIQKMKVIYPDLEGESSLEMSAKVIKNEISWRTASSYPLIGKKAEVQFGEMIFTLNFKDNKNMSFVGTSASIKGIKDDVVYTAKEIRPNVYMVYWTEPKTETKVVHVQDLDNNIVYTNIVDKNGTFTNMKGSLKVLQ